MGINKNSLILVTGATGFIGTKVVETLVDHGFCNLRCFARITSDISKLNKIRNRQGRETNIDVVRGDLLFSSDCLSAAKDVSVIYHLALGEGGKSFPNSFLNAVIPTRNLLEAALQNKSFSRFVNISSFAVYSNGKKPKRRLLDESCLIEDRPELRWDAYAFGKIQQDKIVVEYGRKYGVEHVIMRPGVVYGPTNDKISGRIGIDTFGLFMHLGGSNQIPFTYVDNCAEAIVLGGIVSGVDGEIFNIVDDDLPTSRKYLGLYKKNVNSFPSIYLPKAVSYLLCCLWEKYSILSEGQLPPAFSRRGWEASWKKTRYSNEKLKRLLGWKMKVSTEEGLERHFAACRAGGNHA